MPSDPPDTLYAPYTQREVGGQGDDVDELLASVLEREGPRVTRMRNLDSGGMGRIEVVRDRLLQREMARKVLHPELGRDARAVRHFLREAQITAQLDHPAIVPVHDLALINGELEFTMKMVRGRTLTSRIDALPEGPLAPETLAELLGVIMRVCDALALAHAKGVLHCDIKPDNIMIGDWGEVYLMDWGIAQPCEPSTSTAGGAPERIRISVGEQGPGVVAGTPAYMAPEQVLGEALDPRTDVFAMGAVLYQLVTRHPPYEARTVMAVLLLAEDGEVVPPNEAHPDASVPRALEQIIMRALAKHPSERYARVEDLRLALQQFLLGGTEFRRVRLRPGQYAVREGEPGNSAYIVERGRLRVYKRFGDEERTLRTLGRGEVFGETAILAESPRTASVVAIEDTWLVVVTRDTLEREIDGLKAWVGVFVRTLARRFKEREDDAARTPAPRARASSVQPVELANLVLMHLLTWGSRDGGRLILPWDRLAEELMQLTGADAAALWEAVQAHPELQIDLVADRIACTDPAALRRRLHHERR
ncbi:protein kinase domain-containing protein [Paraliomyxa miuraensis]|uniref:protein kinase domain-containing protein n=1 Tax=Paraliomyxa miuraensis TaxID=376150 RepID=UPI002251FE92|nr:cyclic nucleotide-binding domain-containing protein [Paraliomyxa miuraensis]MCX4247419.1 cyclic nucleotide-binding domain-containing protein [Paraliomyxa miuraensis]